MNPTHTHHVRTRTPAASVARARTNPAARALARVALCLGALSFGALGLSGCERDSRFDRAIEAGLPVAVNGYVAWLVPASRSLRLFDPDTLTQRTVALPAAPGRLFPAPDGSGLAVLDDEGVTWIPMQDEGAGAPVRYVVGAAFSAVTFNPENTRLVLHHARGQAPTGGLTNLNQIALVDLNQPPGADNPVPRTLRAFGEQPNAIVVAPVDRIGAADRQLAWVLSSRYLVLVDLLAPRATEVSVQLTLEGDDRLVVPVQVVPARSADGPVAFVRAQGTQDLYLFSFDADAAPDAVPRPVLNELPAGIDADDLAVLDFDDGLRAFLVGRTRNQLLIVNPLTSELQAVALEAPASQLVLFRAPRPADDEEGGEGNYALAYAPNASVVSFIDLDRVDRRRSRAISTLRLNGGLTRLLPLPGRRAAVATMIDRKVLNLLDFSARTATPLTAAVDIDAVQPDPEGGAIYVSLPASSTLEGDLGAEVVSLDPDTGSPVRVALPEGADLLVVPGARRLVAVHGPLGRVSVFDRNPAPGATVTTRDLLFLEGLLDP